jgi:hypothetical protein
MFRGSTFPASDLPYTSSGGRLSRSANRVFLRYAFAASDLWYTSSGEWLGSDLAFSGLLGAPDLR